MHSLMDNPTMVILTFYQLESNNKCHRWDLWSCKQLRTSFSPEREHHNIFRSLYAHNDNQTICTLLNKTLFCTLYMKAQSPVGFHPRRSVCCSASIIFVNKSYDLALACVRRREMDKSGVALSWRPHKWLWGRTMASSTGPSPESLFLHHQHLLPHIQNHGMFCRLCLFCFFRAATLFEKRQTAEHTSALWTSANFCFTKTISASYILGCLVNTSSVLFRSAGTVQEWGLLKTITCFACFGNNLDQIWTTKDVPDIEKEKS